MDLPGPVGRQDHHRRLLCADRPDLGNCDLEVGENLEQVRLELFVCTVEFVDEEYRSTRRLDRLQERPGDEKLT